MITTHVVIISWKSHMPNRDWNTPRTALEIIWVTGDVTLMLRNPAMQIKNPTTT